MSDYSEACIILERFNIRTLLIEEEEDDCQGQDDHNQWSDLDYKFDDSKNIHT